MRKKIKALAVMSLWFGIGLTGSVIVVKYDLVNTELKNNSKLNIDTIRIQAPSRMPIIKV